MDISMLSTLSASLSAIKDIGSTLISVRDDTKLLAVKSELMTQIVTAREAMFAIQTECEELRKALAKAESELAKINQQHLELDKYERFNSDAGIWMYRAKGSSGAPEESPGYCAHCFEDKILSILQTGNGEDRTRFVCPRCKNKYRRS